MAFGKRGSKGNGGETRDMVGKNPTGRERKSSAGSRRKAANKLDRDLKGTDWE